ncbi:MAG: helix-turn-helix transcriptional regulator [Enterococcus sp.]|nr:helix-turn-helix transcriptional regulator [Enterococcus sp.]HRM24180.1 helix-turn-helix transcriptional regulator [Enterococcus aquimarinus]
MDFSEQLKTIRKERGLTQEQLANELMVSRQAISNWENNKNLPDLEMVVRISKLFHLSLDELILGGNEMTHMAEKLIHDGKETRRAKLNLISINIGAVLLSELVLIIYA